MKIEDVKIKYEVTTEDHEMTRRDWFAAHAIWFAAHAMQALVDYGWGSGDAASRLLLTAQAYAIADEMEKARVKK